LGVVGAGAFFLSGDDDDTKPAASAPAAAPAAPPSAPPVPPVVGEVVEVPTGAPAAPAAAEASFEDQAWDNYEAEVEKIKREIEEEQRAQAESLRELKEKASQVLGEDI